jgi:hypothetical protein
VKDAHPTSEIRSARRHESEDESCAPSRDRLRACEACFRPLGEPDLFGFCFGFCFGLECVLGLECVEDARRIYERCPRVHGDGYPERLDDFLACRSMLNRRIGVDGDAIRRIAWSQPPQGR